MALLIPTAPTTEELSWLIANARAPRLRTMRQFAEQEIIIPAGPFVGLAFRVDRQPFTGLLLDAMELPQYNRSVVTGPTQTGKTLIAFVLPTMFHLFEIVETVICAVPHMEMAADKWRDDLLPVIERSRYRDLLPRSGSGSRGGTCTSITFGNGAPLRFMTGGGSDKSVAGFTSRVVIVTETDGMDEAGSSSREADRITQLEVRTRAYGARKRIYLECTVSIEKGRTWQEYQAGTTSRIVLPCPHCADYVSPEREHLAGWQDATDKIDARAKAFFACPACGEAWSEADRIQANLAGRLIHRGQDITPDGTITGDPPRTDTLAFRWSAVNNLFATAGDIGLDEFNAAHDPDEDNAERKMCQFVWALPYEPPAWDAMPLTAEGVMARANQWAKGIVPEDVEQFTIGLDLGKFLAHWTGIVFRTGGFLHIADYSRFEIPTDQFGVEKAMLVALRQFRDLVESGWACKDGQPRVPDQVWIDAGYQKEVVYAFCRESGDRYRPCFGRGASQQRVQYYNRPKKTGAIVRHLGEGFHISRLKDERLHIVDVDADHWKTWTRARFSTPLDESGSMSLYQAMPREHMSFAKHNTAEKKIEEFIAGKGMVTRWDHGRVNNHWGDSTYLACAAGHLAGFRLIEPESKPQTDPTPSRRPLLTPDGRPYLITERSG